MTSPQYPTTSAAPTGETPLWAPLYGATIGQAIKRFFTKYADFTGRASRSEYWWWILFSVIVAIVLEVLALGLGFAGATVNDDGTSTPGPLFWIPGLLIAVWSLGTIVPHLALIWRRLHDADLAGPFFFLGFVPIVGGITVLVLTILPSKLEGARFDRPRA
ncbi:Uncharacterized membrane protein YhaH, DUF805 family [Leifsonia sp. 98AMF]|uniref:DUF805 domain-containing protein n=1 Tax=unclassified Leifsonia TaxID=2663824 RepID=UPI00087B3413|nr:MULTISPECIES: DUF805 domain-containing protein [unclassified Leifsonia]SDH59105.1 Uncharacterized membrane protein YhaH, DUF805 family [Leifsonia sp. 197AMF]SDI80104.1 Uncharacterized membrane protein YhaH, DUF805 family [Leifsonia sp. 466MF]SDK05174.1 Uncharacterized membrane protein YhaH, DUF805 family [Leifsonia sp. 157MF]SDN83619.1 Uncharacterized membrane protein YhaH, DUF805 family [Leifsonia sp. 509MF]SEN23540.1 Uncharacterized membrane protein YhaH, DUF805 family [Leifsonia sp. 467M